MFSPWAQSYIQIINLIIWAYRARGSQPGRLGTTDNGRFSTLIGHERNHAWRLNTAGVDEEYAVNVIVCS